jgi:hypothetical protein
VKAGFSLSLSRQVQSKIQAIVLYEFRVGKAFGSMRNNDENEREDVGTGMILARAFRVPVRHSSAIIF